MRKLRLNLGVRFDYFNSYNLAQDIEAGLYVDALHFERVDNVPNWKDAEHAAILLGRAGPYRDNSFHEGRML